MALSASTNFTLTAAQLIAEARALLGVLAEEQPLEAADLNRGILHLNLLLKSLPTEAATIWAMTEGSFTLVLDDADYIFGAGGTVATVPFDMTQVRITRSSVDMDMEEISREQYRAIPNKTASGRPTQWFYDRQQGNGTLYVWPVSDSGLGTIKFSYRRTLQDIDNQTNNIDLPQEWYEAILYNLADRLVLPYGKQGTARAAKIEGMAVKFLALAGNFDTGEGRGSIMIERDYGR